MKPGYYWVSIKDVHSGEWKNPTPKYFDQDMVDIVLDEAYDQRTVKIVDKVLPPFEGERLKVKLDECRRSNEVLKRRLTTESSCVKGY